MITKLLGFEEGFREKPYLCSQGYPTIGIGKRIGTKYASLTLYPFTCPRSVADAWLNEEVEVITDRLDKYDWFAELDTDRRLIIISMSYQMGVEGVLCFSNMIRALEHKQWAQASVEALDSRWARQTPARAHRHAEVLRYGMIEPVYRDLWV